MSNIKINENESTRRHLRKKHNDWSEEKIAAEAKRILEKYVKDNKERLEEEARKNKESFDAVVDRELTSLWLDSLE